MEPFKIVIVDDHKIIRDGIVAILKGHPSLNVVGSVSSGEELFKLMKSEPVDLVLLDMHMPLQSGVEVAREVKARYPHVKILINTMSELAHDVDGALAAGVNGYLLKTAGSEELMKAILIVAHGNSYYTLSVIKAYIKNMNKPMPGPDILTPSELLIVKMIYEEKKHAEIINELKISHDTFVGDLQKMFIKLKVNNEIGLIKYAIQEKLIKEEL